MDKKTLIAVFHYQLIKILHRERKQLEINNPLSKRSYISLVQVNLHTLQKWYTYRFACQRA